MLLYNTMRFGSDHFSFDTGKKALLIAKVPLDTGGYSVVSKINIQGNEPEGTARRFLFKIDNQLYKFSGSTLVPYNGAGQIDDVLENGNTASQLTALSDIAALANKSVYPVIALSAAKVDVPTVKLSFNLSSTNNQLTYQLESDIFALGQTATVNAVSACSDLTGKASVLVKARLRKNNSWGSYVPAAQVKNQTADAMQFQITYTVTEINGSDSATVNHVIATFN